MLHEQDVKSANVLLKRGDAKLADVGLSQMLSKSFANSCSGMGTFSWAATELLLGSHPVSLLTFKQSTSKGLCHQFFLSDLCWTVVGLFCSGDHSSGHILFWCAAVGGVHSGAATPSPHAGHHRR